MATKSNGVKHANVSIFLSEVRNWIPHKTFINLSTCTSVHEKAVLETGSDSILHRAERRFITQGRHSTVNNLF